MKSNPFRKIDNLFMNGTLANESIGDIAHDDNDDINLTDTKEENQLDNNVIHAMVTSNDTESMEQMITALEAFGEPTEKAAINAYNLVVQLATPRGYVSPANESIPTIVQRAVDIGKALIKRLMELIKDAGNRISEMIMRSNAGYTIISNYLTSTAAKITSGKKKVKQVVEFKDIVDSSVTNFPSTDVFRDYAEGVKRYRGDFVVNMKTASLAVMTVVSKLSTGKYTDEALFLSELGAAVEVLKNKSYTTVPPRALDKSVLRSNACFSDMYVGGGVVQIASDNHGAVLASWHAIGSTGNNMALKPLTAEEMITAANFINTLVIPCGAEVNAIAQRLQKNLGEMIKHLEKDDDTRYTARLCRGACEFYAVGCSSLISSYSKALRQSTLALTAVVKASLE